MVRVFGEIPHPPTASPRLDNGQLPHPERPGDWQPPLGEGSESEVDQLYVDPDFGGQGVARRPYEAVERLTRDNGRAEVRAVSSLRAEPAFRRFGFREVARYEQSFSGQTFTVVRMSKHLDEAGDL